MVMITHVFKVCDLIKKMKTNNWYRSVVPLETDHNIVHAGFFFPFHACYQFIPDILVLKSVLCLPRGSGVVH